MTAIQKPTGARSIASAFALVLSACAVPVPDRDDPEVVPPIGGDAIEAWFQAGHYFGWYCEPKAHTAIAPAPHGSVRVCANPIAEQNPAEQHRMDTAIVLEIYDTSGVVVGRGVQRRTSDRPEPDAWYWYMRVWQPSATKDGKIGVLADGWGYEGPAKSECTTCHHLAGGSSYPGRDFVFVVP
jgi:hypothetical protein